MGSATAAEKPRPRSGVLARKRVVGALREALAAVVEAYGTPQKAGDADVDAILTVCCARVRVEERVSGGVEKVKKWVFVAWNSINEKVKIYKNLCGHAE